MGQSDSESATSSSAASQKSTPTVLSTPTPGIIVTHQGWSIVKAVGSRTPVSQATGLSSTSASVTLSWNDMTVNSGSISSYNIYRANSSQGQIFSLPLASKILPGALTYTDTSVTNETTYFYLVRPIINGIEYSTTSADSEIKVSVPPAEMALVHRWMANLEFCNLMGRTPDRANHYRCAFSGPGSTNGYYDFGKSIFYDQVELGCNYTPAPACGDAVNGCLGTAIPGNGTGIDGNVFYNRSSGICYYKKNGAWLSSTANLPSSDFPSFASNRSGLPPITSVSQQNAWYGCSNFSTSLGPKRLPTRKEFIAASAWSSNLSDSQIVTLESGSSLPTSGACNDNYGNGLTFDDNSTPADLETIPGVLTVANLKAVRTGSNSTKNCVSRYGIQDLIGNVEEWSSDQITCDATTFSCQGITSALDSNNSDWKGYAFDGTVGPGGTTSGQTAPDYTTQWQIHQLSFGSTRFIPSLGILAVTNIPKIYDSLVIGTNNGNIDPAKLHTDGFYLWTNTGDVYRAALNGGRLGDTASAGRYSLILKTSLNSGYSIWDGFRCVADAETSVSSSSTPSTIKPTQVFHQGWAHIQALGGRTPATQAPDLTASSASVTLKWNAMTPDKGSISSYNIYRATSSGGQNFNSPLASNISTSLLSYTDTTVANGTTYYYVVRAVSNGSNFPTIETDSEIKVIVPPANMGLVHRWMANQEICKLMNKTPDRTNNYRCAYTGPGNTANFYDLGKSYVFDLVELGCNYTPAPACGDAVNGCLGTAGAAPNNAVGVDGNVYYDRTNQICYMKVSGSWTAGGTLTAPSFATAAANTPGLPPFTGVTQAQAWTACSAFSAPVGSKRLPTRKEFIAASAWDASLSDLAIPTLESGYSLPSTGACNTNLGNGLTYDNNSTPANMETVPSTLTAGVFTVRTGSNSTRSCVSRYGFQDMVGNLSEWSSDQITCNDGTFSCTGNTSTVDVTNTNFNGFPFNGTAGPGGTSDGQTNPNYTPEWLFEARSYNSTRFLVPLGLPMVTTAAASYESLKIGAGSGQFDITKLHGDRFYLWTNDGNTNRTATNGGRYNDQNNAGRFSIILRTTSATQGPSAGVRCVGAAE